MNKAYECNIASLMNEIDRLKSELTVQSELNDNNEVASLSEEITEVAKASSVKPIDLFASVSPINDF